MTVRSRVLVATFALAAALAGCESNRPATMIVPGQVRRALSQLTELSATAQLVAKDGTRQPEVALLRAADGVSFSGFIAAGPGDYQLEVVFEGIALGLTEPMFLGRWVSDGFTIAAGSTANPTFSQPLDPIGRPEDGGDPDGDRLGNIDEIIWGSDPGSADSDADGVTDGADCAPDDPANAFTIVDGGSLEDCDGDGIARPDVPFGGGGTDCDDRNPTIFPGAQDECTDAVDQDCNPGTCPTNDVTAPMIFGVAPPDGSTVGCHTRLEAQVVDDGNVAAASVYLEEPVPGQPLSLFMQRTEGDEFRAPPFNDVSSIEGLLAGQHAIEIRAQDSGGNMVSLPVSYDFAFDIPRITSMTPSEVGSRSAPFEVEVQATAAHGVALLQLMAAKRGGSGTYNTQLAVEIGRSESGSGTFTVDPAALGDGEHLLYAMVTDTIGNALQPSAYPVPIGGVNEIEIDADFRCIAMPAPMKMPARVLVVGPNAYQPATMGELMAEAVSQAAATDPAAELVSIIGFGIRPDGKVGLDDAASFTKRWQFAFYNAASQRALTVSWYTPAFTTTTNPVIDPNAGNVTAVEPFPNPGALVDSDEAVAAYGQAGCPPVAGTDDDWILYQYVDGSAVVSIYNHAKSSWRGTATTPITEIFACN